MNDELLERREKLVRRVVKGISVRDAADDLVAGIADPVKKQRQFRAILRDWSRRETWLNDVVRCYDTTFLGELVAGLNEATSRAWYEYARGDNSSARIGALRSVISGKAKIAELLLKANALNVPNKQAETLFAPMEAPFMVDPLIREAYLRDEEQQRQEKKARETQTNPESPT